MVDVDKDIVFTEPPHPPCTYIAPWNCVGPYFPEFDMGQLCDDWDSVARRLEITLQKFKDVREQIREGKSPSSRVKG